MTSAVVTQFAFKPEMTADARYQSAIMRFRFGDGAQGREILLSILDEHPSHAPTLQLMSRLCVETGNQGKAFDLLARGLALTPSSIELQTLSAELRFLRGEIQSAREMFRRVVRRAPLFTSALVGLGILELSCGENRKAESLFRRALATSRDCLQAYEGLVDAVMPGPKSLTVLEEIHRDLTPATYVQLGASRGAALRSVGMETQCVVVTKDAELDLDAVAPNELYSMSSTTFFDSHDLREILAGASVDLALLRGPSSFESLLSEFVALERHAGSRTVVVVEGTHPVEAKSAHRRERTDYWVGDRWKLVSILKAYRPDLYIQTLPCAPSGLTLITGLDAESSTLSERLEDVISDFAPIGYDYLRGDPSGLLNVVEHDIQAVLERICKRWEL